MLVERKTLNHVCEIAREQPKGMVKIDEQMLIYPKCCCACSRVGEAVCLPSLLDHLNLAAQTRV